MKRAHGIRRKKMNSVVPPPAVLRGVIVRTLPPGSHFNKLLLSHSFSGRLACLAVFILFGVSAAESLQLSLADYLVANSAN